MKELNIDPKYPCIEHLRKKGKSKIPGFAFDYLEGGCNNNVNAVRNIEELRKISLKPFYLNEFEKVDISSKLFDQTYNAPFGIAPIGLQGLIWPKAPKILAKAAKDYNIPFILSTVATEDIETIMEVNDNAWFQLYHPKENSLRDKIIDRCKDVNVPVLVVLADVPSFGYRPKEIKNGLSIPPRMTFKNILQIVSKPEWALKTLSYGQPEFKTLKPYLPKGLNLKHLGLFMNQTFDGRLNERRIREIRDRWPGKLVLKGVASNEDAEKAIAWGMDGLIISNHGGRQLDNAESTINTLLNLDQSIIQKTKVMIDSGARCGPDIANFIASGASFVFMGRAFMYAVAAMAEKGGDQAISILMKELTQVCSQLGCENINRLPHHKI